MEPEIPQLVKIAAFVDYQNTQSDEYIVVQMDDLYMHYNRAVGFNKDSGEHRDSLVIVRPFADGTDLIQGLDVRTSLSESVGGEDVLIEVCAVDFSNDGAVAYMHVSIGYGDTLCPAPTTTTLKPTPSPTRIPTSLPTSLPTLQPSSEQSQGGGRSPSQNSMPSPGDQAGQADGQSGRGAPNRTPNPTGSPPTRSRTGENPSSPSSGRGPSGTAPAVQPPSSTGEAPSSITYDEQSGIHSVLGQGEAADKNGISAGGIIGILLGLSSLLCLIYCCLQYRLVWEKVGDYDDEEFIEVGDQMVAIRRTKSLEKEAGSSKDSDTLASNISDSFLDDVDRPWYAPYYNSEPTPPPFVGTAEEQAGGSPLWMAYEERQKDRRPWWTPRPDQVVARIQDTFRERKERRRQKAIEAPPSTSVSPPELTHSSSNSTREIFDPVVERTKRGWFDVILDPLQADNGRTPPWTANSTHHDEAARFRQGGESQGRGTEGSSWDEKMFL